MSDVGVTSMTPPSGASSPVVAYDFTKKNTGLSLAANLVAANQLGNSNYDLVVHSSPVYCNAPDTLRFCGGSAIRTVANTSWVEGSAAASGLLLSGVVTVEMVWAEYGNPASSGNLFIFGGNGDKPRHIFKVIAVYTV